MFRLNEKQTTKKGEVLFPFTVKGDMAYCFDSNKNTVIRPLSDFDFITKKQEKEVKTVIPSLEPEDQIFAEEVKSEELFSNEEETSNIEEQTETSNENTEESAETNDFSGNGEENTTNSEDNTSNIWGTIGDSYI